MSVTKSNKNRYKCPYCGLVYNDSRIVRTHISLSKDKKHKNYNGIMNETEVYEIDENDSIVDTLQGKGTISAERMDEDVPHDAFPESITDKQVSILRTAVRNHNVDNLKELQRRVQQFYDIDVSYQEVRKLIKDFYITEDEKPNNKTYSDLTPKQKAIIDIMASKPNISYNKKANIVGVSSGYPSHVEEEYEYIINERSDELSKMPEPVWNDDQISVVKILQNEDNPLKPVKPYDEIAEEANVPINIVSTLLHGYKQYIQPKIDSFDKTDSPVNIDDGFMTASPNNQSNISIDEKAESLEDLLIEVIQYRKIAEKQLEYTDNDLSAGQLSIAIIVENKLRKILEN